MCVLMDSIDHTLMLPVRSFLHVIQQTVDTIVSLLRSSFSIWRWLPFLFQSDRYRSNSDIVRTKPSSHARDLARSISRQSTDAVPFRLQSLSWSIHTWRCIAEDMSSWLWLNRRQSLVAWGLCSASWHSSLARVSSCLSECYFLTRCILLLDCFVLNGCDFPLAPLLTNSQRSGREKRFFHVINSYVILWCAGYRLHTFVNSLTIRPIKQTSRYLSCACVKHRFYLRNKQKSTLSFLYATALVLRPHNNQIIKPMESTEHHLDLSIIEPVHLPPMGKRTIRRIHNSLPRRLRDDRRISTMAIISRIKMI